MLLLLLIFVSLLSSFNCASLDKPCQTPNGQDGTCILINKCQFIYSHFERGGPIAPTIAAYIRNSNCGLEDNVHPKVCCPVSTTETKINTDSDVLPETCGISSSRKIVGGEKTDLDEFPWMALLKFRKSDGTYTFECGGSLINKRYVITAAHCILPSLESVRLGEYNIETKIDCVGSSARQVCAPEAIDFGIEEKIPYKGFDRNSTNRYDDIGLLRLDRDVNFNDFIRPICLPLGADESYKTYAGKKLTVAGWGYTEKGVKSNIKLKVDVPVNEVSHCENNYLNLFRFNFTFHSGQMCAGGEKDRDSCRGDSGGPLMTIKYDADGIHRHNLIGLVSFGPSPCGKEKAPAVYTRVVKYIKWIIGTMRP